MVMKVMKCHLQMLRKEGDGHVPDFIRFHLISLHFEGDTIR